ncbi:MAG: fluoride efflux transporter CrcB [Gammaproteobacteria bacterium]|nr:fluoride efflux transporter CrcB [Gammaproteobacteria bacterium]
MQMTLAIAVGGAAGALLRYWVSTGVHLLAGRAFPYGTLAVNVSGSLLMGLLYVLIIERMDVDPLWRGALLIGLLGAFTTFSTFSIETLNLLENGEPVKAAVNVLASVSVCIVACWVGMVAGRQL